VEDLDGEREIVDGRIVRDNVYGTLDQDALRRDFTVNALYYNIRDFSVVDFTTGMEDLRAGVLRFIGDPETRLREDPVRMLRVARFAAKLGFRVDPALEALLPRHAGLLADMPPARLFDEVLKLFHGGYALESFELLRRYGLFAELFPESDAALAEEEDGHPDVLVARALESTDARVAEGKPVNPAFLFAAFLWAPMRRRMTALQDEGLSPAEAQTMAADQVIAAQATRVALPRRYSQVVREIWQLQQRLPRTSGKRPYVVVAHPRFRAAYDFLAIRAEAGEPLEELVQWWQDFQEAEPQAQERMVTPEKRRRRRRRKPRSAGA
jgi:poly(A) polymerase